MDAPYGNHLFSCARMERNLAEKKRYSHLAEKQADFNQSKANPRAIDGM